MGNVEAVAAISPDLGDALAKVAVFTLVQGLVYLILRKSSDLFSTASGAASAARSRSFRPMRSMSVRRVLAAFSDVPFGAHDDGGSSTFTSSSPAAAVQIGATDRAD
ncbi:uncharacterized protein LOC124707067 [Lolium rigidum]|uniref:uncharacterized protein LOC124707067 n=1 Tax=Lolium rigidum TaxID=89674 RepID=UPI001F5C6C8E|nr:uncharacterized protein LOC124707067 [Lolium rigidum]